MYHLLIVDDEKYTVDGLYEMLQEVDHLELELHRAYSSEEALEHLRRTKIDIALCDIRMPGMDGLELQKVIRIEWPRCRVIFLTGIRDVVHVQEAIRNGSNDYILKTEGDEAIIQALDRTILELNEEMNKEELEHRMRQQWHASLPLLQTNYLLPILTGAQRISLSQKAFSELKIPLMIDRDVMMIVGRVDQWPADIHGSDQALLMYGVQNIASDCYQQHRFASFMIDGSHLLWLIQSAEDMSDHEVCIRFIRQVTHTMELVQRSCRNYLKLSVSLIGADEPSAMQEISAVYQRLRRLLFLGMGSGEAMLLTERTLSQSGLDVREWNELDHTHYRSFDLGTLEWMLGMEQPADFEYQLQRILSGKWLDSGKYSDYLEGYCRLSGVLLSYLNQWDLLETFPNIIRVEELLDIRRHASKEAATAYLRLVMETLYTQKRTEQDERTHRLIQTINRHIAENLGEDLSLTRLSEMVFLNPTYLSKVYKQYAGKKLSEHIMQTKLDKAKELLANPSLKIYEIGTMLGFETAGYFSRFFKNNQGITPQEYRDQLVRFT